jgi:single-strand selective monofunctional uracil DNA glycosylase
MAQTGVPFGDVQSVRGWLAIDGEIGRPDPEHPERPIRGFDCQRREVSGTRLWSWCKERFGTPEAFFARFFVHNYCPLAFMAASGRNITPDKLPVGEREALFAVCDRYLAAVVDVLEPRAVVGIGAFAEARTRQALAGRDELRFGRIPHPSPASPAANRGWADAADQALRQLGI